MISFRGFDVTKYIVVITRHAEFRALERGIDSELVDYAIHCGRIERFGKRGIKFIAEGKETITCVGEVRGDAIIIFTVE